MTKPTLIIVFSLVTAVYADKIAVEAPLYPASSEGAQMAKFFAGDFERRAELFVSPDIQMATVQSDLGEPSSYFEFATVRELTENSFWALAKKRSKAPEPRIVAFLARSTACSSNHTMVFLLYVVRLDTGSTRRQCGSTVSELLSSAFPRKRSCTIEYLPGDVAVAFAAAEISRFSPRYFAATRALADKSKENESTLLFLAQIYLCLNDNDAAARTIHRGLQLKGTNRARFQTLLQDLAPNIR